MLEPRTQEVVERMGLMFEADGLPRIAGRLLAFLLLSREAHSLEELEHELQISRTSASSNARLLERAGVLERVAHPGDRRDYYRVAEDVHTRMLEGRLRRLRATRDLLEAALETPRAEDEAVRERLETYTTFFTYILDDLTASAERWREVVPETERARQVAGLER